MLHHLLPPVREIWILIRNDGKLLGCQQPTGMTMMMGLEGGRWAKAAKKTIQAGKLEPTVQRSTFVRWSLIKSIKNHAYGMSSQIQLVLLSFSVSVLRMIQHPSLPACCALKVAGRPSTTTGVSQHHELIPLNGHFRCTNPRERRSVIAVERYVDW